MHSKYFSLVALALLFGIQSGRAADWPSFRGPRGDGTTEESAPLKWSSEENVAWRVALPQPGNGSPIVVGDRVLLNCSEDQPGKQRSTYCFDAQTGRQLWVKTVTIEQEMPHHKTNPHGSATPASDGRVVISWHASAGLFCYDLDGNELWSRDFGKLGHMWGYGASPIIHHENVILNSGPGATSFIAAFDLKTGSTTWRHDIEEAGTIDRREDGAPHGSWSSPVIARVAQRDQVILMRPQQVVAYDAETGDVVWSCDGLRHDRGDLAYSSPVIGNELCFVIGGYKGPSMSIRLGGRGDISETHRLFRKEQNPQSIGSGVFVDGYIYVPTGEAAKGLRCIDPVSGESTWSQRTPAAYWGSLVYASGRFYVTDQEGTTFVFRPNSGSYEELSRNPLGEACNSTPAISGGRLYIRTAKHLYCIADVRAAK